MTRQRKHGKKKKTAASAAAAQEKHDQEGHLDETLEHATQGFVKTVKTYRTPLIIGAVLIACLPVPYVLKYLQTSRVRAESWTVEQIFESEPTTLRTRAKDFLATVKGKPLEVGVGTRYVEWLRGQGEQEEALRVAKDLQARHPKELTPLLAIAVEQLEKADTLDRGFQIPESKLPDPEDIDGPPIAVEPLTVETTVLPATQPATDGSSGDE